MIYLTRSSFMCPALLILLLSSVLLTPFKITGCRFGHASYGRPIGRTVKGDQFGH